VRKVGTLKIAKGGCWFPPTLPICYLRWPRCNVMGQEACSSQQKEGVNERKEG